MKKFVIILFCFTGFHCLDAQETFPAYRGYVNDFARVISASDEDRLESLARETEDKTTAQLAFVTLPDLKGESVERYATGLFEAWGIGQRGKDNGILFLLAMEERKFRIEVGYGVESLLPDGRIGDIMDTYMIPFFRRGDFGSGFYRGAVAVSGILAEEAGVQITGISEDSSRSATGRAARSRNGGGIGGIIFIIILLVVTRGRIFPWLLLSGMMGGGRRGGFGGGGFGGGFGGFGGGMSGGGGATRGF